MQMTDPEQDRAVFHKCVTETFLLTHFFINYTTRSLHLPFIRLSPVSDHSDFIENL